MNITQERIDDLNALLKVQVSAADYQDKVDAVIKNYRKTANVPGFRKGKVPVGQIKRCTVKLFSGRGEQAHQEVFTIILLKTR